jgi:hypothetical protein
MGKVAVLTQAQRNMLINKRYNNGSFFNPIKDANGNWIVSKEEIDLCNEAEFYFIKDLELTEHEPIPDDGPVI